MESTSEIVNGTTYPATIVENGITYEIAPRISLNDYPGKYIYWAPFTKTKQMVGVIGYQGERTYRCDDSYYLIVDQDKILDDRMM